MEVAKKLKKSFSELYKIKKVMICSYWIITRKRRLLVHFRSWSEIRWSFGVKAGSTVGMAWTSKVGEVLSSLLQYHQVSKGETDYSLPENRENLACSHMHTDSVRERVDAGWQGVETNRKSCNSPYIFIYRNLNCFMRFTFSFKHFINIFCNLRFYHFLSALCAYTKRYTLKNGLPT